MKKFLLSVAIGLVLTLVIYAGLPQFSDKGKKQSLFSDGTSELPASIRDKVVPEKKAAAPAGVQAPPVPVPPEKINKEKEKEPEKRKIVMELKTYYQSGKVSSDWG